MQVTRRDMLGSFAGAVIALLTGKWRRNDFDFEFRWVPDTYQARVQRAAVLCPLMGEEFPAPDVDDVARARQDARDGRGTTIGEILKTLP